MRSAVQVLREMGLIKSQLKGDPKMMAKLLHPLEEELKEIAGETPEEKNQGKLPLEGGDEPAKQAKK